MADPLKGDDGILIQNIAQGDKLAMRTLYERHSAGLSAFVNQRLRDPVEAADIVHDTFMEVWTKASSFQGRSSVRSWMFSIARNKAVDRIRKLAPVQISEPDETIADETPQPEKIIENTQDASRVRTCLGALSDAQRIAITLAFFEDMTYREISSIEGVSEGTIKTRIFHAKKLLMHCLSKDKSN
ncbi:MAG: sigma-70 family RNA polymerase sigma factor [Pseudomonadota bacterium]